jgi:hypothetical protein
MSEDFMSATIDHHRRHFQLANDPSQEVPILAPPRRPRFECTIVPLRQIGSVAKCKHLLNELGMDGWKIAGIDNGLAYMQRAAST